MIQQAGEECASAALVHFIAQPDAPKAITVGIHGEQHGTAPNQVVRQMHAPLKQSSSRRARHASQVSGSYRASRI